MPAIRAGPSPRVPRSWTIRRSREPLVRVGQRCGWLGAVLEAVPALLPIAAPPHIGPVPGDAHGRSGVGDWPSGLDPLAEQQSAGRRQASVTVQGSLRGEWVVSATPTLARRLESSVDPCQQGPWALQLGDWRGLRPARRARRARHARRHRGGLLRAAVRARQSIVFAGAPGAGKTTLLSCCAAELDPSLRVVVAEEVFEVDVPLPNVA